MQDVGQQARVFEELATAGGFGLPLLGEADIHPPGELVGLVPLALPVAEEDERIRSGHNRHPTHRSAGIMRG